MFAYGFGPETRWNGGPAFNDMLIAESRAPSRHGSPRVIGDLAAVRPCAPFFVPNGNCIQSIVFRISALLLFEPGATDAVTQTHSGVENYTLREGQAYDLPAAFHGIRK